MGLIGDSQAINILDRLACEQQVLSAAVDAVASGTPWYQRVHAPLGDVLGDPDVEKDLVTGAVALDRDYRSGTLLSTIYSGWVRDFVRHTQNQGSTNLDDFLSTRGINVHQDFNPLYASVFGSSLDAVNVYRNSEIVMGTVDYTGSGVCTFTDGSALGTGSGTFSDTNTAAASLKAKVTSAGGIGGNDVIIKVVGTDESSNEVIATTTTIPSSSALDTEVNITTSAPLVDVTAIQCHGGTNLDQIEVLNIVERTLNECSGTILKFDGS